MEVLNRHAREEGPFAGSGGTMLAEPTGLGLCQTTSAEDVLPNKFAELHPMLDSLDVSLAASGSCRRRWYACAGTMNYLVHFLLAGEDDELRLGSFLGDVVKGRVEGAAHRDLSERLRIGNGVNAATLRLVLEAVRS